ncbi:MAG: TlpA disulfide reductase family protein [Myxococcota bacterium]
MKAQEMYAGLLGGAVAIPLVVMLGLSLADGMKRSHEGPLRSMIGDHRYDELRESGDGFPHYVGRERMAPDFALQDREGNTWEMKDQRGKVVVMNFWSITCPPCLEEMPSIEMLGELSNRWDDVEVVAITTDQRWEDVATVLPRESEVTHLIDPDKAVTKDMFGTELYPETWIIDREGVVRFRFDGGYDWSSPLVLDVIESFR